MKFFRKIWKFFYKIEAEKEVFNIKRAFLVVTVVITLGTFSLIFFKPLKDTSVVINSTEPIDEDSVNQEKIQSSSTQESKKVNGMLNASAQKERQNSWQKHPRTSPRDTLNIEYKAPQVIEREGPDGFARGLPLGTNLVGKLLTSIDTREMKQLYKVLLPYGGKDKNGGSIPKNSILFGTVSYPGKGSKVFIQFSKALLPDGKEVKLNAQALNSKDYSPGLKGDFHGKATERIVSTLGLTYMMSAMTDTLTERQILGKGEVVTPKATAKNAFYQGVSKVSEMEAQRQAAEVGNEQEYVTVPCGEGNDRQPCCNLLWGTVSKGKKW